jgi:hypothetical protein
VLVQAGGDLGAGRAGGDDAAAVEPAELGRAFDRLDGDVAIVGAAGEALATASGGRAGWRRRSAG